MIDLTVDFLGALLQHIKKHYFYHTKLKLSVQLQQVIEKSMDKKFSR